MIPPSLSPSLHLLDVYISASNSAALCILKQTTFLIFMGKDPQDVLENYQLSVGFPADQNSWKENTGSI